MITDWAKEGQKILKDYIDFLDFFNGEFKYIFGYNVDIVNYLSNLNDQDKKLRVKYSDENLKVITETIDIYLLKLPNDLIQMTKEILKNGINFIKENDIGSPLNVLRNIFETFIFFFRYHKHYVIDIISLLIEKVDPQNDYKEKLVELKRKAVELASSALGVIEPLSLIREDIFLDETETINKYKMIVQGLEKELSNLELTKNELISQAVSVQEQIESFKLYTPLFSDFNVSYDDNRIRDLKKKNKFVFMVSDEYESGSFNTKGQDLIDFFKKILPSETNGNFNNAITTIMNQYTIKSFDDLTSMNTDFIQYLKMIDKILDFANSNYKNLKDLEPIINESRIYFLYILGKTQEVPTLGDFIKIKDVISTFENQFIQLKSDYDKIKIKHDGKKLEFDKIKERYQKNQSEIDHFLAEITKLESSNTELEKSKQKIKEDFDKKSKTNEELKSFIEFVEEDIEKHSSEKRNLNEQYDILRAKQYELENKNKNLKNEIKNLSEANYQMRDKVIEIDDLKKKTEKINDKLREKLNDYIKIEFELSEKTKKLEELLQDVRDKSTLSQNIDISIKKYKNDNVDLTAKNERLKTEMGNLKEENDRNQKELELNITQREILAEQNKIQTQKNQENMKEIDKLKDSIKSMMTLELNIINENDNLKKKNEKIETEYENNSIERERLRTQIENFKSLNKSLEAENSGLIKSVTNLKDKNNEETKKFVELAIKNEGLEALNHVVSVASDNFKNQVERLGEENKKLEIKFQTTIAKLEHTNNLNKILNEELVKLKSTLAETMKNDEKYKIFIDTNLNLSLANADIQAKNIALVVTNQKLQVENETLKVKIDGKIQEIELNEKKHKELNDLHFEVTRLNNNQKVELQRLENEINKINEILKVFKDRISTSEKFKEQMMDEKINPSEELSKIFDLVSRLNVETDEKYTAIYKENLELSSQIENKKNELIMKTNEIQKQNIKFSNCSLRLGEVKENVEKYRNTINDLRIYNNQFVDLILDSRTIEKKTWENRVELVGHYQAYQKNLDTIFPMREKVFLEFDFLLNNANLKADLSTVPDFKKYQRVLNVKRPRAFKINHSNNQKIQIHGPIVSEKQKKYLDSNFFNDMWNDPREIETDMEIEYFKI